MFVLAACTLVLFVPSIAPGPPLKTYLLLDSRNVVDAGKASLVLGPVVKDAANPLLKEENAWEMRFDNMQPNVWFDQDETKWKVWYSSFSNCSDFTNQFCWANASDCTKIPPNHGHSTKRGGVFCYAESEDGEKWYKPNLGLVAWGKHKSKDNNILIDVGYDSLTGGLGFGVLLDEQHNASAGETGKWKLSGESNDDKDFLVGISDDGLQFKTRSIGGTQGRFDSHKNVVFDPATQKWLGYVRCTPTAPAISRIQCYIESDTADFATTGWGVATPTGLNSSHSYQPDALVAFRYAGIFLGFANVFNPFEDSSTPEMPGQVNMVLAWSVDGRRWEYINPDQTFIPRQPGSGDWDCCGVFSAKQSPEQYISRHAAAAAMQPSGAPPSEFPFYYTGCNGRFFGPRSCALGKVTVGTHGFAGYRGPGTVFASPAKVSSGGILRVTATGGVSVGVQGSTDLVGSKSTVVDGVEMRVTWESGDGKAAPRKDLSEFSGGAVSLVFTIPSNATLYAYHL